MSSKKQIILAFDAYGTLLSTESIAKQLSSHFGQEKAGSIAAEWRKYQLEYTWRLNSMGQYEPFSDVTRKSLKHALTEAGVSLDEAQTNKMLQAYNVLSVFPDVPPVFEHLRSNNHIKASVFSNGDPDMIHTTLSQSPDISPHKDLFKDVVLVEPTKKFKPAPEVYNHLLQTVGKGGQPQDVWLVSGNPFDVVGANCSGLRTIWVDRSGNGWADELVAGEKGRPTVIVKGLNEVVEKVEKHLQS